MEEGVSLPLELSRRENISSPPFDDEGVVESKFGDGVREKEDEEGTGRGKVKKGLTRTSEKEKKKKTLLKFGSGTFLEPSGSKLRGICLGLIIQPHLTHHIPFKRKKVRWKERRFLNIFE